MVGANTPVTSESVGKPGVSESVGKHTALLSAILVLCRSDADTVPEMYISRLPSLRRQTSGDDRSAKKLDLGVAPTTDEVSQIVNQSLAEHLTEAGNASENERIEFGQIVFIGMIDSEGDLSTVLDADGFVSELLFPMDRKKARGRLISQCFFRIVPPLHYDAQEELERAAEDLEDDQESNQSIIKSKRKQAELERRKNRNILNQLRDSGLKDVQIVYGDEVQLQHVASGKFLTAGRELALQLLSDGNQVGIKSTECLESIAYTTYVCAVQYISH